MTKVLLVMPFFYPHKGGSQKYAEELYSHLLKLFPGQYQVDVLAYNTDHAPEFEHYRGLNIHRIPCFQLIPARFCLPHPFALIRKLIQLSKNKYDFVNAQLVFFDPCWWLWLFARLIKAKSIFTEHVASYPVHQNQLVEIISKIIDKTIGRFSINRYDIVTVTNQAATQFLRQKLHFHRQPINLIYGGVDTLFFSPKKNISRIVPVINQKIPKNSLIITFVGRVIWTKGITYLYQAIKDLIPQIPNNVYFIIAGGGELEVNLKQKIVSDKFSDRVFVTGFIPYDKVRDTLQITDIFVTPSHHNEGFPNTILEAGACQNFVIATNNAGTKEIIKNKQTGLLIPQKDQNALNQSLLWAINHKLERKIMALNLRQLTVSKFDWNKIVVSFHHLLQKSKDRYIST